MTLRQTRRIDACALGVLLSCLAACSDSTGPAPQIYQPGRLQKTLVTAGVGHSCAVTVDQGVYCWGVNQFGTTGADPEATPVCRISSFSDYKWKCNATPVRMPSIPLEGLSAGDGQTCAITASQEAFCWGSDAWDALGGTVAPNSECRDVDGVTKVVCSRVPVVVGGIRLRNVSTAWSNSCGIRADDTAVCWGRNTYGESGTGSIDPSGYQTLKPTPVVGGLRFRSLSVGTYLTCGVTTDFHAYCWGRNQYGQLGSGSTNGPETCIIQTSISEPCSKRPVPVSGGLLFSDIAVDGPGTSACGIQTVTKAAYCWGSNVSFRLGRSTTTEQCTLGTFNLPCSTRPVPMEGGLAFESLSMGYNHGCGVAAGGVGYCWGNNTYGQAGTIGLFVSRPELVENDLIFAMIDAGEQYTCGVTIDDHVYCWGINDLGQLGLGDLRGRPAPTRVRLP